MFMNSYERYSFQKNVLYKVYTRYKWLTLWMAPVVLPLTIGIAYLAYFLTEDEKLGQGCFFILFASYALASLGSLQFLKCPRCGRHHMALGTEGAVIVTPKFVCQQAYVHCRKCGKTMNTDLAFRRNIFMRIATKITPNSIN